MIFSKFLGSPVLSDVEGLLLCIKTKKIERRVRSMKKKLEKILSSKFLAFTIASGNATKQSSTQPSLAFHCRNLYSGIHTY
ncbi:MAG TPA: hypothetical protein VGA95_11190 [Thermodesulfobacteriota bacterium]